MNIESLPTWRPDEVDMKIEKPHAKAFEAIMRAAANGDLALFTARVRATGEKAHLLCAIDYHSEDAYDVIPLARIIDGDPYETFISPGGEFDIQEDKE